MKQDRITPSVSPTIDRVECSECDGLGGWVEVKSIAGEPIDADWIEVECDQCDGTGMVEADEPTDDETYSGWALSERYAMQFRDGDKQ